MAAPLLSISAKDSAALDAVVRGLQVIDKELVDNIRKYTREISRDEWQAQVAEHLLGDPLQSAVLGKTSTVTVSNQNITLWSGNSSRRMKGGGTPRELAREEEFGANQNTVTAYRRRTRRGGSSMVKRHTTHQLPRLRRGGWTVYPAASEIIPRIASLWLQTFMHTVYDAFEGRLK